MNYDVLDRYARHFDDTFPTFAVPDYITDDDKELKQFIDKCIAENHPATHYYPYEDGCDY